MKKLFVLSSALLVLTASAAFAQIDLAWNNCLATGGVMNMNYACDGSRVGIPFRAVMSFVDPIDAPQFVAIQAVMDIQTSAPVLPDFWMRGAGECADGDFAFPGATIGLGGAACLDPYVGSQPSGGYLWTSGFGGVSRARAKVVFARDIPTALTYGTNYLAGVALFDNDKDIDLGTGVCPGCQVPGCIVLNQIELYQEASAAIPVYAMFQRNLQNFITWQGGDPTCVDATPVKNKTWGSVKSLYR
jgi:hypothetical protein